MTERELMQWCERNGLVVEEYHHYLLTPYAYIAEISEMEKWHAKHPWATDRLIEAIRGHGNHTYTILQCVSDMPPIVVGYAIVHAEDRSAKCLRFGLYECPIDDADGTAHPIESLLVRTLFDTFQTKKTRLRFDHFERLLTMMDLEAS